MRSPTLALMWHFWYRHRLGLAIVAAFLAGCVALAAALPAGSFGLSDGLMLSMLFSFGLVYVAAVFAYGFDGPIETRESGYPARLFTLPVWTGALVGVPMLQGPLATSLLWVAWCQFVLRPVGLEVPLGLTALTVAAFVACLQALLWTPFGLPWVRILVAIPVLVALILVPVLAPAYGIPEALLAGVLAALIPTAYLVALAGVRRARRGDVPAWGEWLRPALGTLARMRLWSGAREPRPFASAARAQLWFEWRCHVSSFPLTVGCVLVILLAYIFWLEPRPENKIRVGWVLLYQPLLFAALQGLSLGRSASSWKLGLQMSAFNATRPLTCSELVAAKFKAAALGTLAAWALVAVAGLVWLLHTGAYERVPALWDGLVAAQGPLKAGAVVVMAVAVPLLLTWALLAGQMYLGLTGRKWILYGFPALCFAALLVGTWTLLPRGEWQPDREATIALFAWVGGVVVVLKLLTAGWALRALVRRGQVKGGTLARLLGAWLLVVSGLFVLLMWLLPAGVVAPYLLALVIVVLAPLARLALAPLALAWNRHR
ncbi:MAG: hypothetical protein L0Z62_37240 [Gemmataceae bacterium]|nr:hypothetical protein [Gemmataceae bacterium]